ncbi:tautomerase family protein [Virgibacillus pantothenticus]|uniref:tautomerase family protein n=1 Tax=Virgibacillus pantothenticus TaxID=1473 RepID=UPI001C235F48|nr:tautomerase family protein [Virgibacillus pantothenticus]MBU8568540.1 tautomerase family protein [Virgibacillus pantothenticus]MBU8602489.1 tautomerase family protein [Virgibacillus pantothenticus]MBU8636672.1 tautomerase family protein [Virgibacillus pantothenticus]MBU8644350.1 tautomerase family protein [Virgibacillus pantothenticus]MBU8648490.1 tautomerase family protein [Virgibacillus pantothenticus]
MPLLTFDLIEGRTDEELKALLDATHYAVVKAFGVPERDRYQIVHQHPKHEMIIQDTGLGFERSDNVVVLSIRSTQRSDKQKKEFYRLLVQELEEKCGTDPKDVLVSIVTNGAGDWSFGFGEAQFLTGEL